MTGWENQEIGDWGEAAVKAALSSAKITSSPLTPDLGEDFLIEVEGREASSSGRHPRTALVQVKACAEECHANEIKVTGIKKTKLMRWSSQQLPVFIVAVSGYSTKTPVFFTASVDKFLETTFSGIEIRDIPTESVTVTASRTDSLASTLIAEVEKFHRFVDTDLMALSYSDKRNEHYEILRRGKPSPIGLKAKPVSWSVIWRASQRPAYFAAMIADLFREAHQIYIDLDVPAYVSFHIYRSQYDMAHNMAVARVHWIDNFHPRFEAAARALDRDNPTIEHVDIDPNIRTVVESKTTDASNFVTHVKRIAPSLDDFARRLLAAEASGKMGKEFWTEGVIREIEELDRMWEATPFAPTELKAVEDVLDGYIHALTGHQIFSGKADWNPKGEKERFRLETAEEIQYYYGAWWVLLKNSGWDFPYY